MSLTASLARASRRRPLPPSAFGRAGHLPLAPSRLFSQDGLMPRPHLEEGHPSALCHLLIGERLGRQAAGCGTLRSSSLPKLGGVWRGIPGAHAPRP